MKKLKVFAPFVPLILGMALKLSLIDEVPSDSDSQELFMMKEYAAPLWLDLLVSAYLLPIAAIMTGTSPKRRIALYFIPAAAFFLCLFFVLGLPKFGLNQPMWVVWVPNVVALVCLLIVGLLITE
jgi:lipopolysaccharide export LptBFGC system permease protein LptF